MKDISDINIALAKPNANILDLLKNKYDLINAHYAPQRKSPFDHKDYLALLGEIKKLKEQVDKLKNKDIPVEFNNHEPVPDKPVSDELVEEEEAIEYEINNIDLPDNDKDLENIPYHKLKNLAVKLGLSGAGLKEDIIERIVEYYYKK